MPKKTTPPDPVEDSKRFIEAARELGCDESEEVFGETLGKLATLKPEDAPRKPKGGGK